MEKIKFVADTASDIPDEDLREYGIDMPNVPITVDGEGYFERRSFSILEFYDVLGGAKEIPATSRVPVEDYYGCYERAWNEGCTDIISVTINAGGSGTHTSAQMAKELIFEKIPAAKDGLRIHVVDSRTYSMAYGYPVVQGAKMARAGKSVQEILDYLEDYFARAEVYLGCYTLEYAKKSGRIGAAAAFVGDVLGLRPVIAMIDGKTQTVAKVRGDKNLAPQIAEIFSRTRDRDDATLIIRGEPDEPVEQLSALIEKETGKAPPVYYAGASIIINSGPKIIAVVHQGKRRSNIKK